MSAPREAALLTFAGFAVHECLLVTLVGRYGITAPNLAAKIRENRQGWPGLFVVANTYSLKEVGEHERQCFANLNNQSNNF